MFLSPLQASGVILDVGFIRRIAQEHPLLWGIAIEDLTALMLVDKWWGLLNYLARYTFYEDPHKSPMLNAVQLSEWVIIRKDLIEELRSEVKPFYESQLSCSFEGCDIVELRLLDPASLFIKLK